MDKLNIQKSVAPSNVVDLNAWLNEFKVGSGYVAPTKYYMGNEFDTGVFKGERRSNSKISKLFNTFKFLIKIA